MSIATASWRPFAGDLLVATLFAPATDTRRRLIVTFGHRAPNPGHLPPAEPVKRFLRAGWAHLHIQSRWNDWYVNPETEALCTALNPLTARFRHVSAIGFSMGAYAALRLSAALNLTEVIAVSPQYSIHPDVVPFDRRFHADSAGFDPALGDLARHARRNLGGVLIHDPFRPLDARNAAMIAAVLPRMHLCSYGFGGHPATAVIRETVKFGAVQDLILAGKASRAHIAALHRDNRAQSPSWWRGLADRAAATGRTRLAAIAQSRASSLDAAGDSP
ncbi:alpha/beta hydrolase [Tabrizicola sp. BL-A-41-H6]|uniref:alpha/beta hydrolase n=1 Tax=Tabrizicola sp. BL-A-41-H6 TaxID=3421107 RepID=UPI003D67509A